MKVIAVLSVSAMILVDIFGPRSSVGGPMTDLLLAFIIMWVVGLHFAWSKRLGPLGWLLSVLGAICGGTAGILLFGTTMDTIVEAVHFQGRLIDSSWAYVASTAMALVTVWASWAPLEILSRLRATRQREA